MLASMPMRLRARMIVGLHEIARARALTMRGIADAENFIGFGHGFVSLSLKCSDDFDMWRPEDLVHGRDRNNAITASGEDRCIAGECRRIAGDRDHALHCRLREFAGLRLGAGARWIEDDTVECVELLGNEGLAEEVTALCLDGLKP